MKGLYLRKLTIKQQLMFVVLISLLGITLFTFFGKVQKVHAYAFPNGMPTNVLPNNSSWENGSPITQPAYLAVTRGDDEGSPFYADVHFPTVGSQTINFTIQSACDDDPNIDVGGSRATNQFLFYDATSVVLTGGDAAVTNLGPFWEVVCRSGSDVSVNVTIDQSLPTFTKKTVNGDVQYRLMYFEAGEKDYAGGDWENSFRVVLNGRTDAYASYAGGDCCAPADADVYARTGIYNRDENNMFGFCGASASSTNDPGRNNGQCYWTTSAAFAPPCGVTSAGHIRFFDNDAGASELQGIHHVVYNIWEYKRDGSGNTSGSGAGNRRLVQSGQLNGASNQFENTPDIIFDSQFSYELELRDIYIRNSIQVILPWAQINATDICNSQPKGTADNATCTNIWGWAYDPDTPNQSITIHIYLDGPAGSGAPGAAFTADRPSGGQNSPPDDVNGFFGISGNHRYDVQYTSLSQQQRDKLATGGSHTFYVYAIDTSGGANPEIGRKTVDMSACTPPVVVRCNAINSNPTKPEAGETFTISYGFNISGGASGATYNYSVELRDITKPSASATLTFVSPTGNPVNAGTTGVGDTNFNDTNDLAPSFSANQPGNYGGTFRVSGDINIDCKFGVGQPNPPVTVVTKPYFQTREGDVAAGINGSCVGWSGGTGALTAWNNLANPNQGAGTNLAVLALGVIDGFASAQNRTSPSPPKDLSFANSSGSYGGSYAGPTKCPENYYGLVSSSTPTGSLAGSFDVPDANGTYRVTSANATITGGSIGVGHRPVIYINGDVRISGNITLAGGASNVNAMPNFYLIARGNIYIDPGVNRLDGVYVAQPNGGSGGKIYTCTQPGFGSPAPRISQELNGTCKTTPLVVNGAFIALELKLYRSFGSLLSTGPAELFVYTPNVWLATPCVISQSCGGSTSGGGYEAITSLPPVL